MSSGPDSKSLSRQRFAQFAPSYVSSQEHAASTDLDRLVEIVRPRSTWIVLDIATGGGHTALRFAPFVHRVIATDITPKMLQAAQAFIAGQSVENVAFQIADAEHLPFAGATFNLITCRIAPHHFPDCAQFVRSSAFALKPGGLLLVQDHALPQDDSAARYIDAFERLRDPSHHRAFSAPEWIDIFGEAALQVTHTEQITKRHWFHTWTERQKCSAATIRHLVEMIDTAPSSVKTWLDPRHFGTPEATFVNRHIIIAGRKGS